LTTFLAFFNSAAAPKTMSLSKPSEEHGTVKFDILTGRGSNNDASFIVVSVVVIIVVIIIVVRQRLERNVP
jgi:hypothetical protein